MPEPGDTRIAPLYNAPEGLVGELTFRAYVVEDDTVVVAETTSGIEEYAAGEYRVTYTLPDVECTVAEIWRDPTADPEEEISELVVVAGREAASPYSWSPTLDEIRARLGKSELTATEIESIELLIEAASEVIVDAAGKTPAQMAALSPVPRVLRFVAIEMICRTVGNPAGLAQLSEQLGAAQRSQTFRRDDGSALLLTSTEVMLIRRAVRKNTSGSVVVESVLDDIWCGS